MVELYWVYDEVTAANIAMDRTRDEAFNYSNRDYLADFELGDRLEIGDVFLLTNTYMTDHPVRIVRIAPAIAQGYVVTLEMDDDSERLSAKRG